MRGSRLAERHSKKSERASERANEQPPPARGRRAFLSKPSTRLCVPASTDGGQQKRFFVIIMTSICAANVYHFWHDRKKCCVLSRLLGAPTAPGRKRLAHLRTSPSERGKRESVRYDSSSYDCSRNDHLSRPLYLFCSPLLITFPLLILVVLLRLVRLRSRSIPLFFPVVPFSPPLRSRTRWKCHRHRRARFPSFF